MLGNGQRRENGYFRKGTAGLDDWLFIVITMENWRQSRQKNEWVTKIFKFVAVDRGEIRKGGFFGIERERERELRYDWLFMYYCYFKVTGKI